MRHKAMLFGKGGTRADKTLNSPDSALRGRY